MVKNRVGRPRKVERDIPQTCYLTGKQIKELDEIRSRNDNSMSKQIKTAIAFYLSYMKEGPK